MSSNTKFWGLVGPRPDQTEDLSINPSVIEMSSAELYLASCMNIFRRCYGFVESTERGSAVSSDGDELPLYTYPAIEYLTQFDLSEKRVFEFGAGASTIFFMKRAKQVVSVENLRDWYQKLAPQLSDNVELLFAEGDAYPQKIRETEGLFDVIVVDGAGYRYDSAVEAIPKLAEGGIIILDNSDWHFNTAALLKNSGLLQVDMTGFKPTYFHTSTTSIFFHRSFRLSDRCRPATRSRSWRQTPALDGMGPTESRDVVKPRCISVSWRAGATVRTCWRTATGVVALPRARTPGSRDRS